MGERDRLKNRLIKELYDMGIIHTDPILDRIIDVCQADAGAKGETVSREGALQATAGGDALKPCPFCGGDPQVRRYTDEDLWSHNQVEWTQVTCSNCDVGFAWPPGGEMGGAIAQWNRRAANSQSLSEATDEA